MIFTFSYIVFINADLYFYWIKYSYLQVCLLCLSILFHIHYFIYLFALLECNR